MSSRIDTKRAPSGRRDEEQPQTGAQPNDSLAASKPLLPDQDSLWGLPDPSARLLPGLHIVATPIGNLRDITLRALDALKGADVIACEDTRVSGKLLFKFGIKTPLLPYHEHNAEAMRPRLMGRLAERQSVVLISDAGTPLVSDPGYRLVRDVIAAGYELHALPGASAVLTGLVLSGLPPDRFFFAGFLESRAHARRQSLHAMKAIPGTLIFYESGPRLAESLSDMAACLGDRPAVVARELTKLYEEIRRAPLSELAAFYGEAGAPKGEIVVLVGPIPAPVEASDDVLDAALREAMIDRPLSQAVALVTAALGLNRRRVYARALALAESQESKDV